jgi:hypothetical protein
MIPEKTGLYQEINLRFAMDQLIQIFINKELFIYSLNGEILYDMLNCIKPMSTLEYDDHIT